MTSAPDGDDGGATEGNAGADDDSDGVDAIDAPDADAAGRLYNWDLGDDGGIVVYDEKNPDAWVKSSRTWSESDWR